MSTLGELMEKFASSSQEDSSAAGDAVVPDGYHTVNGGGEEKLASGGNAMASLTDIYMSLNQRDIEKQASAAAYVPQEDVFEEDIDFAKMAAYLADQEAEEYIQEEYDSNDIVKIAAEYDSAGRLMARGFYDEFCKLAGNLDTDVSDNQMTESVSHASTPALGQRGLPTLATNFAGNEAHDGQIETAGMGPKDVYKKILEERRTISAGDGTMGDLTGATSFATVRDLQE